MVPEHPPAGTLADETSTVVCLNSMGAGFEAQPPIDFTMDRFRAELFELPGYILHIEVFLHRVLAAFSAESRVFDSTKWCLRG